MSASSGLPNTERVVNPSNNYKLIIEHGYDQIASKYLTWTSECGTSRLTRLQWLLDALPPKSNVLELGCGAGVPVAKKLCESGHHITANDISAAQLELARKNVEGDIDFASGDMMALTFADATLDAVASFYAVIHLPREEQQLLLQRIHRWLKPGGFVLANFGTQDDAGSVNENWLGTTMYWSSYDAQTTLSIFKKAGFEIIKQEIIVDHEDVKLVPFLWVLARKKDQERIED